MDNATIRLSLSHALLVCLTRCLCRTLCYALSRSLAACHSVPVSRAELCQRGISQVCGGDLDLRATALSSSYVLVGDMGGCFFLFYSEKG